MRSARHPLNSICSYLGAFPPDVARTTIAKWIPAKSIVVDPFCGSGTTLVEAKLSGRPSIGIDLNPLAVAIARSKIAAVSAEDVLDRVSGLARSYRGSADTSDVPAGIRLLYHPRTLAQLVYLRDSLSLESPEDVFLRGVILGILHGKWRKNGSTAYLSIDMPNTFSMSPEYVRGFIARHHLRQPSLDVFTKLRDRVLWLLREGALQPSPESTVFQGDATDISRILSGVERKGKIGIVTSPPYLGVLRYGAFNWIRLWFLGQDATAVDRRLDTTDSLDKYLSFIASFLLSSGEACDSGSVVALVIGDVVEKGAHLFLAKRVWEELEGVVPYEYVDLEQDLFLDSVKTTRIWGEEKRGRATPVDWILVLKRKRKYRRRTDQPLSLRTTGSQASGDNPKRRSTRASRKHT